MPEMKNLWKRDLNLKPVAQAVVLMLIEHSKKNEGCRSLILQFVGEYGGTKGPSRAPPLLRVYSKFFAYKLQNETSATLIFLE